MSRRATAILVIALIAIPLIGVGVFIATTQPPPGLPASPVVGVVTAVDSGGLGQVRGFDLLTQDGATVKIRLGPLENATEFSPAHLTEHMASGERIRAFYRLDAGVPVAYRLEDAAEPAPAT